MGGGVAVWVDVPCMHACAHLYYIIGFPRDFSMLAAICMELSCL